jgi:type IV pilus assembly protein PilO
MATPPLDPQLRRNLCWAGVMVALLGYLFYDYVYAPRPGRWTRSAPAWKSCRRATPRPRLTRGGGTDVEGTLASYRRQLEAVEGLIPSGEELPDLLDAISAEAQRTNVEIALIQPSGATEEAYYTRRAYDMAVVGRYHDVGDFLTRVASLPRIVTPLNLTLAPTAAAGGPGAAANPGAADAVRVEARFSIETYVIPSTPTENEKPAE